MIKYIFSRICIFACLIFISISSYATHLRAAEITYEFLDSVTVRASIVIYTTQIGIVRDSIPVHWGAASADEIVALSVIDSLSSGFEKSIYTTTHTYTIPSAPANFYIISISDPNRNAGILNMANSVDVILYVEDTIWFQGQVSDHSPTFLNSLVSFNTLGDTLFFNPVINDIDGDSITNSLVTPMQGLGNIVPGYIYPEQVFYQPGDTLTIESHSGAVRWATPHESGFYDIAILTREYRNGILIGTALRDMLITVSVASTTGITETDKNCISIKIYPNPAQDVLNIESTAAIKSIEIFGTDGRLVESIKDMDQTSPISIKGLSQGHYILVTKDRQGISSSAGFEIVR